MEELDAIELMRTNLQASLDKLVASIGPIRIGKKSQFPYGWRKAAKGRTVWRILEEIITQNLEAQHKKYGVSEARPSASDVSVYDMEIVYKNLPPMYINIKSAVIDGRKNKDDISKAEGLQQFYAENPTRNIFVVTFFLSFQPDMTVMIEKSVVFPLAWIPDVYVNPSNNGNVQSAYYKDLNYAVRRTNSEFINMLNAEIEVAALKKNK